MDGYMLKKYHTGTVEPEKIVQEVTVLIDLWKTIYSQKEG